MKKLSRIDEKALHLWKCDWSGDWGRKEIARALKAERRRAIREAARLTCYPSCREFGTHTPGCLYATKKILSLLKETRSNG